MFYTTDDLRDKEIFLQLTETKEAIPEKDWLPVYKFNICLLDGTEVGKCDLRIGHNYKTYIGGNIGYRVHKEFRGKHYAAKACRLLFKQAKKHKLDNLYITCVPVDNIASYRTCEHLGGQYLGIEDIPESNEMYDRGDRKVRIYRFEI